MPTRRRSPARSVFINCPFDEDYKENLNALIFAVYDCGFCVRCALETSDSGEPRFEKICQLIRQCRYGIHDLSRTELDPVNKLPRFNMPLELGLFLGAKAFAGSRKRKKVCLVLDTERHRYQKFCSDLAGVDIEAHDNDLSKLVSVVRDWLGTNQDESEILPDGNYIFTRYKDFLAQLPELCRPYHIGPQRIIFTDYISLLESWLLENDWRP